MENHYRMQESERFWQNERQKMCRSSSKTTLGGMDRMVNLFGNLYKPEILHGMYIGIVYWSVIPTNHERILTNTIGDWLEMMLEMRRSTFTSDVIIIL